MYKHVFEIEDFSERQLERPPDSRMTPFIVVTNMHPAVTGTTIHASPAQQRLSQTVNS